MKSRQQSDFAGIACALRMAASALALDVEQSEILAARLNTPGIDRALNDLRLMVERVVDAHDIFKALIKHESAVRALARRGDLHVVRKTEGKNAAGNLD